MNPIQCTFSYEAGAPRQQGWFIGPVLDPNDAHARIRAVVCICTPGKDDNGMLLHVPLEHVRLSFVY